MALDRTRAESDEELLARLRAAVQEDESVFVGTGSHPKHWPDLSGYRITREVYRGGQGVIFEAVHESTSRIVAIKVPRDVPGLSSTANKRLDREVELVGQLKHPNIISVFDSGVTDDGNRFYVMEFVSGRWLDRFVREESLTIRSTLTLFLTVCRAVEHAHQRGVIHRDLKPSNILVEGNGTPKVMDFGLAKSIIRVGDSTLSITRGAVGTPAYMSPEQVEADPQEADIRSDVYSLGVILYRLIVNAFPYPVEGTVHRVFRHIVETPPSRPSTKWRAVRAEGSSSQFAKRARCPIDADLDTILLKALSKPKERRYQSVSELARDLSHFLTREPIEARGDSAWYILYKVLGRHKTAAGLIASLVMTVIVGVVVPATMWFTAATYKNLLNEANRAIIAGQPTEARGYLDKCPPGSRGLEWEYLWAQSDRSIESHLLPDGARLLRIFAAFADGSDALIAATSRAAYELVRGKVPVEHPFSSERSKDRLYGMSPNGDYLAILTPSPDSIQLKIKDRNSEFPFPVHTWSSRGPQGILHSNETPDVSFDPTGRYVVWATAEADGAMAEVWDLFTRQRTNGIRLTLGRGQRGLRELDATGSVRVAVSAGAESVTIARGNVVQVWRQSEGESEAALTQIGERGTNVGTLAMSPDGALLAVAWDERIEIIDLRGERGSFWLSGHRKPITCMAFSPDRETLVSGCTGSTLRLWDIKTRESVNTYYGHSGRVTSLRFSADGTRVLSTSDDGTVRTWNAIDRSVIDFNGIDGFAIDPTGERIVLAKKRWPEGSRLTGAVVDRVLGQVRTHLDGMTGRIPSIAFDPAGVVVGTGTSNGGVKIWDPDTGILRWELPGNSKDHFASRIALSPNHSRVLLGRPSRPSDSHKSGVTLWDWKTGGQVGPDVPIDGRVRFLAYDTYGEKVAIVLDDRLEVWDADLQSDPVYVLSGQFKAAAFNPQGNKIAVAGSREGSGYFAIWRLRDTTPEFEWESGGDPLTAVGWSEDGTRVVSAGLDGAAVIWHADSHERLLTLQAPPPLIAIQIHPSPDPEWIIGAGPWGIRTWNIVSADILFDRQVAAWRQRKQVESLLEQEFAELGDWDTVITDLEAPDGRDDLTADKLSRARVHRDLAREHRVDEAIKLENVVWSIVEGFPEDRETCESALEDAKRVCELAPDVSYLWRTRAVAEFLIARLSQGEERSLRFDEAIRSLDKCEELARSQERAGAIPLNPVSLAVKTMIAAELGNREEAERHLLQLRALMSEEGRSDYPDWVRFRDEAEESMRERK